MGPVLVRLDPVPVEHRLVVQPVAGTTLERQSPNLAVRIRPDLVLRHADVLVNRAAPLLHEGRQVGKQPPLRPVHEDVAGPQEQVAHVIGRDQHRRPRKHRATLGLLAPGVNPHVHVDFRVHLVVERHRPLDDFSPRTRRSPVGVERDVLRPGRRSDDLLHHLLHDDRPLDDDLLHDLLLDDDRLLLLDHNGLPGRTGRTLGAGRTGSAALTLGASRPGGSRRALDVANLDFATGSSQHAAQRGGCTTEIASANHTRHDNFLLTGCVHTKTRLYVPPSGSLHPRRWGHTWDQGIRGLRSSPPSLPHG